MLHREGLAHRVMGGWVDPLPPQAVMSISPGGKVQRLAIRRPVGPILSVSLRNRDPSAFGNRFRPVNGRDRNAPATRLNPSCKTDPAIVGRKPAVEQIVIRMLQQRNLPMRSNFQ